MLIVQLLCARRYILRPRKSGGVVLEIPIIFACNIYSKLQSSQQLQLIASHPQDQRRKKSGGVLNSSLFRYAMLNI